LSVFVLSLPYPLSFTLLKHPSLPLCHLYRPAVSLFAFVRGNDRILK